MASPRPLIIGTRGSPLALWQARHVAARLKREGAAQVTLEVIRTAGDRLQQRHPGGFSAKGIFVKELEDALLARRVDLAVHSVKDLPGQLPPGLMLAAYPDREDPRDALLSIGARDLSGLPASATVGTTSLRRRAQLLRQRDDLCFVDMRGNVDTRVEKVRSGQVDALVLARAGLARLGLGADLMRPLPLDLCLPAPGQGALGIEARADDQEVLAILQALDDPTTRAEVVAERAVLAELDAGCLVPLAALGRMRDGALRLEAMVASPDGREVLREAVAGPPGQAEALGRGLAAALKARGAEAVLRQARRLAGGGSGRGA